MRFAFTEDQVLFRAAVAELLDAECTPEVVRAAWEGSMEPARGVWSKLVEQAVPALGAPERVGGMGMGAMDLIGIVEAAGRTALPGPFVETVFVAPLALDGEAGTDEVLSALAAGRRLTAGVAGSPLPHSGWADYVLQVSARAAVLAPREAVSFEPVQSVDRTRDTALASLDPEDPRVVALGPEAAARIRDAAALGAAAQLMGLASWMIDTSVDYAKVREQFRKPIGAFQAVQHHLADARAAIHSATPLVHRAAHSLAVRSAGASLHVSMAKAQASDAASLAARKALQVHGAIGYSTEHDLHFWMKRTWALARAWGDAAHHRERVAAALLDGPDDGPGAGSAALREGLDP